VRVTLVERALAARRSAVSEMGRSNRARLAKPLARARRQPIISTAKLAGFVREIGTPVAAGTSEAAPPSPAAIERFLATSR
jgi:hypothetical protein